MNFETKTVEVKGNTYNVQELSARQRQEVYKLFKSDDVDPVSLQAHYILRGCVEFKDSTLDEIMDLPGSLFGTLADEVVKISGLADESAEDSEKNS